MSARRALTTGNRPMSLTVSWTRQGRRRRGRYGRAIRWPEGLATKRRKGWTPVAFQARSACSPRRSSSRALPRRGRSRGEIAMHRRTPTAWTPSTSIDLAHVYVATVVKNDERPRVRCNHGRFDLRASMLDAASTIASSGLDFVRRADARRPTNLNRARRATAERDSNWSGVLRISRPRPRGDPPALRARRRRARRSRSPSISTATTCSSPRT